MSDGIRTIGTEDGETIVAEPFSDNFIEGLGGGDELIGGLRSDTLFGGNGDDFLEDLRGNDVLIGGNGDDFIHDATGSDFVEGGNGADSLNIGVGGFDTVFGGPGDDFIEAFAGSNNPRVTRFYGNSGSDVFQISPGDRNQSEIIIEDFDPFAGDSLVLPSELFGVSQFTFSQFQSILMQDGMDTIIPYGTNIIRIKNIAPEQLDQIAVELPSPNGLLAASPEFTGTDVPPDVIGTANNDGFFRAREELIPPANYEAGAGDDTLHSIESSFSLSNSTRAARFNAGPGDDIAFIVEGDTILGGSGEDIAVYGGSSDLLADLELGTISFSSGATSIIEDVEFFAGGSGRNIIFGSNSNDIIQGRAGDQLFGRNGDDFLLLNAVSAADETIIDGGGGRDIFALNHEDAQPAIINLATQTVGGPYSGIQLISIEEAIGGVGNDRLIGNDQANRLSGAQGADTLVGGLGADTLFGREGDDRLFAGTGDGGADVVSGGAGDDIVAGGGGDDIIVGDEFGRADVAGRDTLFGGSGDDILILDNWADINENRIVDAREIVATNTEGEIAFSGRGADQIYGGLGDDTLGGGPGSDIVLGSDGADTLYGGPLRGEASDDTLSGGNGNDQAFGGQGSDLLNGGNGDDTLFGGAGSDTLSGGENDDHVFGGGSNDILSGGAGGDVFYFGVSHGDDIITDFEAGNDQLFIANLSERFDSFELLLASSEESQNGLLITTSDGTILLEGLTANDLNAESVILGS